MVEIMKRFITYKNNKKFKNIYLKLFLFLIFILLINFGINLALKYGNKEKFINLFVGNSFGNVTSSNIFKNQKYYFYKNSYGINFTLDKYVSNNKDNLEELIVPSDLLVYIYNTFQTDKYKNNYYNSYNINPVITQASLIFQEYLKKQGINSLVELNSVVKILKENNIDYTLSYRGSKILMEQALKNNPTLNYFIDIQLSDSNYEETTLFVIGTDNPSYSKNEEFATILNQKISEIEPGISRGISKRGGAGYQGVYNQDFNAHVLLIQVGGKENTIAEVNKTLNVLAQALALYIKEQKDG